MSENISPPVLASSMRKSKLLALTLCSLEPRFKFKAHFPRLQLGHLTGSESQNKWNQAGVLRFRWHSEVRCMHYLEDLAIEARARAHATWVLSKQVREEIEETREVIESTNDHVNQSVALLRGLAVSDLPPFSSFWSDEELRAALSQH